MKIVYNLIVMNENYRNLLNEEKNSRQNKNLKMEIIKSAQKGEFESVVWKDAPYPGKISSEQPALQCIPVKLLSFTFQVQFGGFPGGWVVKNPLPVQETWVRSLVRKDPIYRRAAKLTPRRCWARALEPGSSPYWACSPWGPCSATREAATMRSPHIAITE